MRARRRSASPSRSSFNGDPHIFDPDDPYIESDAVFGVKESLLAEFRKVDDPARAKELGFDGSFFDVKHDFVPARN